MSDETCKKDGGPAFPVQESLISQGSEGVPASSGMTLRDWFAGQALVGITLSWGNDDLAVCPRNIASECYELADAMLAEREKD